MEGSVVEKEVVVEGETMSVEYRLGARGVRMRHDRLNNGNAFPVNYAIVNDEVQLPGIVREVLVLKGILAR
jgi:hypothetical protein